MLQDVNYISIAVRLGLAVIVGGIIGMNRGRKKMPAGFRTHILVCMGAALTMITNQYICEITGGSDPARMGAQVISGIGFLGAGTIIVTGRNKVKGLTTAASLWVSGCMGLAIGIGLYSAAIIACVYMLFVMTVLQKIDEWMLQKSRDVTLYIEFKKIEDVSIFIAQLKKKAVVVLDLDISHIRENEGEEISAIVSIRIPKSLPHVAVVEEIGKCQGIKYIQEM